MDETDLAPQLDARLRAIKQPLRLIREQYGIDGDVTFRIRYTNTGDVTRVTIDDGPANMTPAFISASNNMMLSHLHIPPSGTAGELMFTDLGTSTRTDSEEANRRDDQRALVVREREREVRRKRNVRTAIIVVVLGVAWQALQVIIQL